jgi:glucose/arabinose dehydrogenase
VLLQTVGSLLVISVVAVLVLLAGRYLRRRLQASPPLLIPALLLGVPLFASTTMYGLTRWSLPERERERDPSKRELSLPPGFSWSIYAQGTMDNPTAIAFGPQDELYVADISGALWVAVDADRNGVTESISAWADGFQLLVGLVWHDDELYTASSGKIEALRDTDGDGKADTRRTVVDGLPSMILKPHSNNGLAFGPDGRLYFGVGSTTNGQIETNERAAAILSVRPDGSDLRVYARGLGNSFDVAFNQAGDLFAGDNSPGGGVGGEEYPDEFNYIVEGGHYGFPYFFGDPPENGGTRGAIANFPPHSVPTGVTFYAGDTYPPHYKDSAFITLWARGEVAHVEVAKTGGGSYLSRTTTFGSGFLYPIDAITGPDGNLYIADFGTSAVYRVVYDPNKDLGVRK